jgi:hypothetical protein
MPWMRSSRHAFTRNITSRARPRLHSPVRERALCSLIANNNCNRVLACSSAQGQARTGSTLG